MIGYGGGGFCGGRTLYPVGPATVTNSSLQVVGTVPLATLLIPADTHTNESVFVQFLIFASNESATDIYTERWQLDVAVQALASSYRIGAVSKTLVNRGSQTFVLHATTPLDVDQNSGNLRLLARADAIGSASVWAGLTYHLSSLP